MRFTQNVDIRTSARVTVLTFKHICSLPLIHRPKGVLLVLYDITANMGDAFCYFS